MLPREDITHQYLNEVFVVIEDESDIIDKDTQGLCTLANIKYYKIESAIYNFAYSWRDLKISLKMLLLDAESQLDFEGFETDFHHVLHREGETEVTVKDVVDRLDENELNQFYHIFSMEEIVDQVLAGDQVSS